MRFLKTALLVLCAAAVMPQPSRACSRVVYIGDKEIVLVGRTLDWRTPIPTNLYVYPQGVDKTSMPTGPCLKWKSKYATVLAVGYDGGVTEGMNERGLVMNGLFCKGTIYREAPEGDTKTPVVSLAMLVSYFLDNFATVEEVDTWLSSNDFAIYGKTFDGGTVSALHWAITDRSGQTLLIEYVNGKITTFMGKDLLVLTNDPPHAQMMAIEKYWQGVGGVNMLPGTVKSADRFVRASFFINHVPKDYEYREALGSLTSIMGTVSVPYGYEIEGEPNVSSTQWTSVSDSTGDKYYFRLATSTGFLYIDMAKLMLRPGSPILKLDTAKYGHEMGCVNHHLEKTSGFTPMW